MEGAEGRGTIKQMWFRVRVLKGLVFFVGTEDGLSLLGKAGFVWILEMALGSCDKAVEDIYVVTTLSP